MSLMMKLFAMSHLLVTVVSLQKVREQKISRPVLDVIKASTAIVSGRITTVNHSPCYKTVLQL